MINFIVITHGEFGAYMIEAAEQIVGRQEEGVRSVGISARLPVEEARRRLKDAVTELSNADGLVLVVDMPGGTPCNIALPLVKDLPKARVRSGVNLYMLVTAFNGRKTASLAALVGEMIAGGKRSAADIKALFLERV